MIKRTKSLSFRILLLTMGAIICCILITGWIGISAVKSEGDRNASRHMNLICDDKCKSINEFLISVAQSADMTALYAADDIKSMELVKGGVIGTDGRGRYNPEDHPDAAARTRLEDYLMEHTQKVLAVIRSSSSYTHGVFSYFYRLNPQFSARPMGFWRERKDGESFSDLRLTDISTFGEEDFGRAGWYYTPLDRGEHVWMEPYRNENLDATVISYVIPVYKAGTFIGVVGMDILFDSLVEQVGDIRVFESGYAYLTDENGKILYHPTLEAGTNQIQYSPELALISDSFRDEDGSGENTVSYTFNGEKKKLAFNTLANGMKLIVVAPAEEINAGWHLLVRRIIVAGILVLAVFGAAMAYAMTQIITPLTSLTEASRHLAAGDYDVELNYSRQDEVGVLTDAFRKLTAHLKMYINDLNSRAYRDALTGVRNKGAYDISVQRLNDAIRNPDQERPPRFAVVLFDCDGLKQINDVCGHEKGDLYLQKACRLICRVFSHSPVFRVGGDEFVALLQQEDYDCREALLAQFAAEEEKINGACEDPWEEVHVSSGLALYDPALDENAESVFSRADALMYENKKKRKTKRT